MAEDLNRYDKINTMVLNPRPIQVTPLNNAGRAGMGLLPADAIAHVTAIRQALLSLPDLQLAVVFGSFADGRQSPHSDLDIAVALNQTMSVAQHIDTIGNLAVATGRPIDLIDLRSAGEALLGQIMQYGVRILGSDVLHAQFMTRHIMNAADFMPYQTRILKERRQAWISK